MTLGKIKRLQMHQRRLDIIKTQLAQMGKFDNRATTHLIEAEDIEESIKELKSDLERVLQHRKEQQAISGINTDPMVLIEIENIENVL